MKKLLPLLLFSLAVIAFISWQHMSRVTRQGVVVSIMDIGQGDSIFIRTPEGGTVVIDGGPDASVVQKIQQELPWWQSQIDYLIMTHSDSDHYPGLIRLVEKYKIKEFWFNGDASNQSPQFQYLLRLLREHKVTEKIVKSGDSLQWNSGVSLDVLWPENNEPNKDRNDICVVTRLRWGQESALFTCDLPGPQEAKLLQTGQTVVSDILKVGHHGSKYSSTADFLQAVAPKICLISSGKDNRFNHPNPEAVERLQRAGCDIHNTQGEGSLRLLLSTSSFSWLQY